MAFSKALRRRKIRYKIRKKISGTSERPRLSVFRSNKYIYAQIIDDLSGTTLASVSSREIDLKEQATTKKEEATLVGKKLAERAAAANISSVLFDRSGYLYHGRVKALADGAREGGLQF
ncbi:MAG: 50S ribosomal protein L18 [Chitinophagales bacterium]